MDSVVSTPWPGPRRVEGAAPAGLNVMLMVLCIDYSSLELTLGALGMIPTREVDGVCRGVVVLSQWSAWLPQGRHS